MLLSGDTFPTDEYHYTIELEVSHDKISHYSVIISGPSGCYLVTPFHPHEYNYKIDLEFHIII